MVTLFCSQYEEPLIQAQGAHPNKYLFGVETAEWFIFSVSIPNIHIHVNIVVCWDLGGNEEGGVKKTARKESWHPMVMWTNLKRWKELLGIYMVEKWN